MFYVRKNCEKTAKVPLAEQNRELKTATENAVRGIGEVLNNLLN